MLYLNEVTLLGRMGTKVQTYNMANGSPFVTFAICTNEKLKDGSETANWHNCEAWGNLATIIERMNPTSGQEVLIKGKLKNSSWEDSRTKEKKSKTTVLVTDFKIFPIVQHPTAQCKNENFKM